MSKRATTYIIRFMVGTFKALKHLENLVPKQHSLHPVSKSQVAPMKILDVDEKYTQGNLDILDQLKKDTELCGDHQVIIVSLQPNVLYFLAEEGYKHGIGWVQCYKLTLGILQ